MTTTSKFSIGIVSGIMLATLLLMFAIFDGQSRIASGSVTEGQGYMSTTTSSTFAVAPGFKTLRSGAGIFGSLVVTTTGTGVVNIYDATTTTNGAIYGTTTLASLTTSAAGTYTFDANFNRGLLVETVGANTGTTTITWK